MANRTITNLEQLHDLIFEVIEINNVIAESFSEQFIHENEYLLLMDLKSKLLSTIRIIDSLS